ncbi:hypothetical protein GOP47_0020318 [Adiantum capillus-veneris]|uniref:Uncharacterized protein n=1 Tax=Adiantum capillus-veneris TaxID=13818 RepID=A0A9D4UCR3_ADICA|nr:hypothetical protein GOP47_0020318 [Adiantum capillus-veneris]
MAVHGVHLVPGMRACTTDEHALQRILSVRCCFPGCNHALQCLSKMRCCSTGRLVMKSESPPYVAFKQSALAEENTVNFKENTFKNTSGGKKIFFEGKLYDARDPVFIQLRNENMIKTLEELHYMFDYSDGFTLYDSYCAMKQGPICQHKKVDVSSKKSPQEMKDLDHIQDELGAGT